MNEDDLFVAFMMEFWGQLSLEEQMTVWAALGKAAVAYQDGSDPDYTASQLAVLDKVEKGTGIDFDAELRRYDDRQLQEFLSMVNVLYEGAWLMQEVADGRDVSGDLERRLRALYLQLGPTDDGVSFPDVPSD